MSSDKSREDERTSEEDGPGISERFKEVFDLTVGRGVRSFELASAPPPEVGSTPKDVLYERGTLRLYHYRATTDEVYRVPLLIVMATTNKGYLFDLMPGQSMVEYLVNEGYDVYMIDWGEPVAEERALSLADYTQDFLPHCVRLVQEDSGEEDITLVGYCQGGVLSLIYAATHLDGPVKNLVLFTTPVDQHKMDLARVWSDPRFLDIDRVVDTLGVIPPDMVKSFFEMLRPAQRTAAQLRLWEQNDDPDFVASFRVLERWGDETLGLPGQYYRDTTRELMWENKLYTGELEVDGKRADIRKINVPVMHAVAQHDHIVPYEASKPLIEMVASNDKHEIVMKGGHVSLVAGPRAVGRLWPQLNDWLSVRSV
jgi:polyhydroxyalkanoate synthase